MRNKPKLRPPDRDAGYALSWLAPGITAATFLLFFLARYCPDMLWAFNLWDYLPSPVMYLFMASTAAVSFPPVLRALSKSLEEPKNPSFGLTPSGTARLKWILFISLLFAVFWAFPEKRLMGDWYFLTEHAKEGNPFEIKEAGGSFLFFVGLVISKALHVEYLSLMSFFVDVTGVGFLVILWKTITLLFDTGRERKLAMFYLCASGIACLFFGHIEIYGFLLVSICAYIYFAVLFIQKKTEVLAPALMLGIAIWFHLSAVFLIPSLAYLIFWRGKEEQAQGGRFRVWLKATFFLLLPFSLFLFALEMSGYTHKIMEQYRILAGLVHYGNQDTAFPAIMPFFKERTFTFFGRQVTQYHLFSKNHLLFLFNSNSLLSPFSLLILGIIVPFFIRSKRLSDIQFNFLLIASVSMLAYSVIIYPVYWSYDWDLFSATAFCCALLGVYIILRGPANQRMVTYLLIYFSLLSLLFFTAPFVLVNSMDTVKPAGPFSREINSLGYMIHTMGNPDALSQQERYPGN